MSYETLRYNEVRQKSVHNCFQRSEGVYDQLFYWRVRSLEVDIHTGHPFDDDVRPDDWFVYHFTFDPYSSVHKLGQFLQMCAGFHRAVPQHEVVTLFIDIKDGFPRTSGAARSRRRFDELLDRHLGANLFRPLDLMARDPDAPTLTDVVQNVGWPTLAELRGRFIVVLTGSSEQLGNYIGTGETQADRSAFVSGSATKRSDIGKDRDIVIYNMSKDHVKLAKEVGDRGYVSRAYYIDDEELWAEAVQAGCNHIATDMVNSRVDPWADTSGPTGFPFEAHTGSTPQEVEAGSVAGAWARSGDIWEREDSCFFRYHEYDAADADQTYVFAISGPNSHTENWTKGGIVARESDDPDACYFGVFRPGTGSGLRVQYRRRAGRSTTVLERHIGSRWRFGSHFDQDTLVFVRLRISDGGRRARGFGSVDGRRWTELGDVTFDEPLLLQGLAVSAHDQGRGAKFLFIARDGRPLPFDRDAPMPEGETTGWFDADGMRRWRVDRFSR